MSNCDFSVPYGIMLTVPCSPSSGSVYIGCYSLIWRY